MLAAESLFAEYGLHGASLRMIGEPANQKNASAIQYHFGTRDKLVEAVFENRMQYVNPKRLKRLDELERTGQTGDVRALLGVWVWPLAEELQPRPEGNHYLQFLARSLREKHLAVPAMPQKFMSGLLKLGELLLVQMKHLPNEIAHMRIVMIAEGGLTALARFEEEGLSDPALIETRIENLLDMMAASLVVPYSGPTLR